MITITCAPAGIGSFRASVDGRELGVFRTPLFSAARRLLAEGVPASTPIALRHARSPHDALRSTVGAAADLTVSENDKHGPRLRRYRPMPATALDMSRHQRLPRDVGRVAAPARDLAVLGPHAYQGNHLLPAGAA